MSKFENFNIEKIKRSLINEAEYNPRKISDSARKKLKKVIKNQGLVQPIIVNKLTMNIVGGHQRVSILDELNNYPKNDYEITCSLIEVDEKKEIELNIFLNNGSAMGEWDNSLLVSLKEEYNLDFINDLGFDLPDMNMIFGSEGRFDLISSVAPAIEENQKTADELKEIRQSYRDNKKENREKNKIANENGDSYMVENNDFHITFVFNNNKEKHDFMERIAKPVKEKYLKGHVLESIFKGDYLQKKIVKQEGNNV